MNFFGREKELEILRREEELSASSARFTIVMGRRRIGKTSLIRRNFQGRQCLYILAKNEAEATFCTGFPSVFGDFLTKFSIHCKCVGFLKEA